MLFTLKNMDIISYNLDICHGLLPYYLSSSLPIKDIQKDKKIEEIEQYLTPEEILKIIDEQEINFSDIDDPEIELPAENKKL